MKNKITISVKFYFKGQQHTPTLTIELDEYLQAKASMPAFFPLLASANQYDLYSYEYEMMQAEPLRYSNATGLIAEFIENEKLDTDAFLAAWQKNKALLQLQRIVKDNMQINNLQQHPELEKTLLEAYQLGQQQPL